MQGVSNDDEELRNELSKAAGQTTRYTFSIANVSYEDILFGSQCGLD